MSTTDERCEDLIKIVKSIKTQYHNVLLYSNDQYATNCYSPAKDAFDKFLALAENFHKSITKVSYSAKHSVPVSDLFYYTQLLTLYETIEFAINSSSVYSAETYDLLKDMQIFVEEELSHYYTNLDL